MLVFNYLDNLPIWEQWNIIAIAALAYTGFLIASGWVVFKIRWYLRSK